MRDPLFISQVATTAHARISAECFEPSKTVSPSRLVVYSVGGGSTEGVGALAPLYCKAVNYYF